jgi:hypothetical protein
MNFPFALSVACPEPDEGSKGFDKLSLNGFFFRSNGLLS